MLKTVSTSSLQARYLAREALVVATLTGLTVAAAKVAIPLPGTPVPATLQVAAVVFAGAAAGSWRGAISQLLYLLLGLTGLPVFAAGAAPGFEAMCAPTAGYLLAFPLAAWLAGCFPRDRRRWLAAAGSLAIIYVLGAGWLLASATLAGKADVGWALQAGVLPFLVFDLLKSALAVWTAGPIRMKFFEVNR